MMVANLRLLRSVASMGWSTPGHFSEEEKRFSKLSNVALAALEAFSKALRRVLHGVPANSDCPSAVCFERSV
jgi:hypothetical protein